MRNVQTSIVAEGHDCSESGMSTILGKVSENKTQNIHYESKHQPKIALKSIRLQNERGNNIYFRNK